MQIIEVRLLNISHHFLDDYKSLKLCRISVKMYAVEAGYRELLTYLKLIFLPTLLSENS